MKMVMRDEADFVISNSGILRAFVDGMQDVILNKQFPEE